MKQSDPTSSPLVDGDAARPDSVRDKNLSLCLGDGGWANFPSNCPGDLVETPFGRWDSETPEGKDPYDQVCRASWLGRIDYPEAMDLQETLAKFRSENRAPDFLLLLEHPHTYTLGRRGKEAHLLVSKETLAGQGVKVYHTDRGGDITYHGPGQLVGYPIINLKGRPGGVSRYLRDLEEVLIRGLNGFGVAAGRLPGFTGVWVHDEKIAAIGIKLDARGIARHGFCLNVTTDLSYFDHIIPCGIRDKGVTSIERVLNRAASLEVVAQEVATVFGEVFGFRMKSEICEEL